MSLVLVKPTIEELRELIGGVHSHSKARSSFSLYPDGFALGSVTELVGAGKTHAIALFLKEHSDFKVAWVESHLTINPYALFQLGVNLENILFIEAQKDLSWCLDQTLQSGCFKVVVAYTKKIQEKDLRRYQLISEKNQSHFFLLSERAHKSWVPQLQLRVLKTNNSIGFEMIRKRGYG